MKLFGKERNFEPGLVLYESKEDFILTASEISLLDIETDMVVLSSCNSALKDFNSLYKSFLVAGSNSVLYTHWELDTKSAPEITESFFTKLWFESKLPKHESLRAAILEMKSNYSDDNFAHISILGKFCSLESLWLSRSLIHVTNRSFNRFSLIDTNYWSEHEIFRT